VIKERYEKIKQHIKEHKVVYSIGITAIVTAGITLVIMRSNGLQGGPYVEGLRGGPENIASFNFRNSQTINVTTVIDRDGRGHPGWPVRNLETKHIFLSQKEAAKAFDIPQSLMSGHINGKFPDIDGLHFERVNLVPQGD
jgi:hypothetical protein